MNEGEAKANLGNDEWEYTMDGMSVHHMAPCTHSFKPRDNSD